jgi:hypothetical protein
MGTVFRRVPDHRAGRVTLAVVFDEVKLHEPLDELACEPEFEFWAKGHRDYLRCMTASSTAPMTPDAEPSEFRESA